jgi:D-serine deaminase-like pyridoxal phosphate-dependent protein
MNYGAIGITVGKVSEAEVMAKAGINDILIDTGLHRCGGVGSTPTYRISWKVAGITEVRPGNAVFFRCDSGRSRRHYWIRAAWDHKELTATRQ